MAAELKSPSVHQQSSSTRKLDFLKQVEEFARNVWAENNSFHAEYEQNAENYFVTFPFPYMNGRLHLGHAFSLTKSEFTARFQRLQGKNVLWPFAFHCTGMPIAACADKLKRELEDINNHGSAPEEIIDDNNVDEAEQMLRATQTFSSKKSKATAKTDKSKTQIAILESLGVDSAEIPKFSDAKYWLQYFPPKGKADLEAFGVGVDWRRSFITTDANPYFDKFVQWQFRVLKSRNRIKFGLRPSIFSTVNNQPVADHDRASGEGAVPQEYTLVKLKVLTVPASWTEKAPLMKSVPVYLIAATLRPETMYGQTNCFVLPEGLYGAFPSCKADVSESHGNQASYVATQRMTVEEATSSATCVYICSKRAALNLAYQKVIPLERSDNRRPISVLEVKGTELIGLPLKAPLTSYNEIFALPMPSISMEKGTGIVTSVPSDAPDDFAMLRDLQEKKVIRDAYGIDLAWCQKDIIEIIEIPGFGRQAAAKLCVERKVASWKDEEKLKLIKQEVYLKGFYEGVMLVGPHKGSLVKDIKDIVKKELIESGEALTYHEPSKKVVSRAGDDCIVALCNQWYSDFGNQEWKDAVANHVNNNFEAYGQLAGFQHTVSWIEGWACSRTYGLGTYLPWELEQGNKILIESLSDSTIYFAYYTIAHMLQGNMYGSIPGSFGISPEELTDAVFDYIFCQTDEMPQSSIDSTKLTAMRTSFEYWYPMNLRCSGKDLVQNHLTMSLFHHAAIWPKRPDLWPRGYFVNGHLLINAEKMSKSTGNFLSLSDGISQFSADATRIALADAGDGVDDANFETGTAVAALLRLYTAFQWVDEMRVKHEKHELRTERNEIDEMIQNEMKIIVGRARIAYETMTMRDALKWSFYEFSALKETYRMMLAPSEEMQADLVMTWIEWFSILISPIACHSAEYIWSKVLGREKTLAESGRWPVPREEETGDPKLRRKFALITSFIEDSRKLLEKGQKGKGKRGGDKGVSKPNAMTVFVAKEFPEEQRMILKLLQNVQRTPQGVPEDPKWIETIRNSPDMVELSKKDKKMVAVLMGFASFRMKSAVELGDSALSLNLPFDELEFLRGQLEYIKRSLGMSTVNILSTTDTSAQVSDETNRRNLAVPGTPSVLFATLV